MQISKKRILKASLFCVFFLVGFYMYHQNQIIKYALIKKAIPLEEAYRLAEDPTWHLLKIRDFGWIEYEFYNHNSEGRKGEFVELVCKDYPEKKEKFAGLLPYSGDNLKYPLLRDGNLILIKAEICERFFDTSTPNPGDDPCCRLFVEDWEIVAPIYRDYEYQDHSRWFYPKEYIDEYDLKHGDYIPE